MKFPDSSNKRFWIVALLFSKAVLLAFLYLNFYKSGDTDMCGLVFVNKDFMEYYFPVEHLITNGIYSVFSDHPYAGRMPGYIIPALPLRLFFSKEVVIHITVILQIILSVISSYSLGRMLEKITKRKIFFLSTVIVFSLFTCYSFYDIIFHPASFAISSFILSITCFYKFTTDNNKKYLFLSGLLLAWVVFLRPFLGVYLPVFALVLFLFGSRNKIGLRQNVIHLALFFCSLVVFETVWIARNFKSFGRFIPLQTSFVPGEKSIEYNYIRPDKYSLQKLRELIYAWGGDNVWYYKGGDMDWFINSKEKNCTFKPYCFTSVCTPDSLVELRRIIKLSMKEGGSAEYHDSLEQIIIRKSEFYTKVYKTEHKWRILLVSPFLRMKNLVVRNVVMDWPGPSFSSSGFLYKGLKLAILFFYFSAILLAGFSLFRLRADANGRDIFRLALLSAIGLLLMFALLINFAHHSYFYTGFVSVYILAVFFVNRVTSSRIK